MKRMKKGEIKSLIEKYIETEAAADLLETTEFLQKNLVEKIKHCDKRSIRAAMEQIPICQDYPECFQFLLDKQVYEYGEEYYFSKFETE